MEAKEDVLLSARAELTDLGRLQEHSDLSDWPGRAVSADSEPANGHFDRRSAGRSRVKMKGKKHGVKECCCNEKWVEFTENTSLHGLRYIWLRDAFLFRRLLWLVLTLACSGIMMYQILDRIIYFDNKPVTVDVRINFNTTLDFPAVTICNQNAFRASATAELGYYDLLTDLYGNAHPVQAADLDRYSAQNVSTSYLYAATTHQINDLLVSCKWRGERCGQENFTQVATDHGMCYTFDSKGLIVDSAGAEDGLSLTLNVEQYEYMPGPHDAAGVKILVHHKNEFPKVHALGQAMSAGVHSFIAVRLVSVENLPYPHGECDSPRLTYFSQYWTANCETECTMRLLQELCGCKLFYMPGEIGDIPVCTLGDIYDCYIPKKSVLRERMVAECYCPVPCSFLVFDPLASYAVASPLVVERFLADVNKSALAAKFDLAREVTHRHEPEKRKLFKEQLDDLEAKFTTLQQLLLSDLSVRLTKQKKGLLDVETEIVGLWNETSYLFKYQKYIVEKDFVRAAAAMSERTFDIVASAMQEVVFKIESKITTLASPNYSEPSLRKTLYVLTLNEIDAKLDITQRALENYTQLFESIVNGTPIFNYKFRKEPRENSVYIVPLPLFDYALRRTRTVRIRSRKVDNDLRDITHYLNEYRNITEEVYETGVLNYTAMHFANVFFLKSCREYRQSIDMFLNDGLGYTVTFLEERHTKFNLHLRDFKAERDNLLLQIDSLLSLVQGLEEGLFLKVAEGINMSRSFLADGSVRKKDIARLFVSEDVQLGQSDFRNFFAELRARGQEVYDAWDRLETNSQKIQNMSKTDPNLQMYYTFKNTSLFHHDLADVLGLMHSKFDHYKTLLDIRDVIKHYDDEFLTSLDGVIAELQRFLGSGEIDASFIRNNFVRLNIFYRELNYEQITQQPAYGIFALLCDIGGSMGLFLGASVLTIFELLDLFVFHVRT